MHTTTIEKFGRVHYDGGWDGDIEFVLDDEPDKPRRLPAEMVRAVARLMLADEIERVALEIAERIAGEDPKPRHVVACICGTTFLSRSGILRCVCGRDVDTSAT